MPGMTAKELVGGITKRRPGVHVVFMSGYMGDVVERQGLVEPGVNFLPKPFTVEELLRVVRKAAGGSTGQLTAEPPGPGGRARARKRASSSISGQDDGRREAGTSSEVGGRAQPAVGRHTAATERVVGEIPDVREGTRRLVRGKGRRT